MIYIAPSLLSADMARLSDAIQAVETTADYIHCDIMDGHFVPNLTFGPPVVKAIKRVSKLPLDVHLMINDPVSWIDRFIDTGLDSKDFLTFHIEAEINPQSGIERIIDRGVRPGLSIKPGTYSGQIIPYLDIIDQLLVMSVEPGFGGQQFMRSVLPKIRQVRKLVGSQLIIGIDGGIDVDTIPQAVSAGADLIVAGSAVYGRKDGSTPAEAIHQLRMAVLGA